MFFGGGLTADSNITKRALAAAFKELLKTKPFSKISISDICEQCEMNRKSFYYHYKDKYDLVNWIYYTEFISVAKKQKYVSGWDLLEDLCEYFYDNREFYRKTFNVVAQNSFSEYFREVVVMIFTKIMDTIFDENEPVDFYVDFYSDAFFCAIKKWITNKDCVPPKIFVESLKKCLWGASNKIVEGLS